LSFRERFGKTGFVLGISNRNKLDRMSNAPRDLSRWHVQLDLNAWTHSIDLFANWSAWAQKAGEYVGSQKNSWSAWKVAQVLAPNGDGPIQIHSVGF